VDDPDIYRRYLNGCAADVGQATEPKQQAFIGAAASSPRLTPRMTKPK